MKRVVKQLRPFDIDRTHAQTATAPKKLRKAIGKLEEYIEGQSTYLTNYRLRKRQGKPFGTSTGQKPCKRPGQSSNEQTPADALVCSRR
jgi:hypothetical protein